MSAAAPSIDSTYGSWLISFFLETILYGIGVLQTWLYFQWAHMYTDNWTIKLPVTVVMFFETLQISFFCRSTYFRFVQRFGVEQGDLVWSDSLQLLANYLSAFTVQIYFASSIFRLTKVQIKVRKSSGIGIIVVVRPCLYYFYLHEPRSHSQVVLAFVQLAAGITQTVWSYELRSYSKLDETKAITSLQTASSLLCDVVITVYLCAFLSHHKNGLPKTESMMNNLMMNAVNRGMLTAVSSAFTMILFLVYPDTFWFFLSLAPNSKLYMNSMLATLNMRQHIRDKFLSNDQGWNTIELGIARSNSRRRASVSAVEFVTTKRSAGDTSMTDDEGSSAKMAECSLSDSV
ncbi:hypothetical protein C8R44DRAFT_849521 [Mycena epipterygia]|nr:hypothetical protein C8R44DRAFT_849521 [Mycena epipterygia]